MKKASTVNIGNEILNGQTVNTNAAYLSKELLSISIPVVSSYVIGDDVEAIVKTLTLASEEADVVIVTGGLGPTDDDLTRLAFSKFLDVDLLFDEKLLSEIEAFFSARNLQMPQKNRIQAYLPAKAQPIPNKFGTAPGIIAEHQDKLFIALPGVPSEMKAMFTETVKARLKKISKDQAIVVRKLKCFGESEAGIAEKLGDLMHRARNPLINCTAESGVITLHIIAEACSKGQAEQMVQKDEAVLRNLFGEVVYGIDEQSLAEVVGEKLAQMKRTVSVAESCSGGTLAKLLTDAAGASRYFTCGWVTYSNLAKINQLGVSSELIDKYGSVSEQVAAAMAEGARKNSGSNYAIAITGIAGPTGSSENKPVGLVFIALDDGLKCQVKRFVFAQQGREFIRYRTALAALNMLRLRLFI